MPQATPAEGSRDAVVEALRLRLALDAGRLGTWHWDIASGRVEWDARLEAIFGFEPGEFDGSYDAYVARLHPAEREAIQARVREAVADRSPYDIEHRIVWPDGTVRWIQGLGDVTTDAYGDATGTIGCVADITERKSIDADRAALILRLSLLAEASAVLADSLDLEDTFDRLTRLCVPQVADVAMVWLAREGVPPRLVAVHHANPEGEEALRRLDDEYPLRAGLGTVGGIFADGAVQVVRSLDDDVLERAAVDDAHLALLRRVDIGEGVAVPIMMRGRVLGVLAFGVRRGVEMSDETVAFAHELAHRLPHAVQNSVLFETASTVAEALQAGLAPPPPPDVPGLAIAARYHAAGDGVEIGGDFYDFVALGTGRYLVVVGDVCGRGPSAATLNAQVRFATRALARAGLEPTAIAARINDNVVADVGDQRFCTAVFAALDIGETLMAEIVSAGHPSPMVLRADGTVATIATSGPLLGVLTSATYESTRVEIATGDTLVVLTDGLLEARDAAGDFFEPLLMPLLERMAGRSVEEVADAITAAVSAFTDGHTNDDIAVVVIQPTA